MISIRIIILTLVTMGTFSLGQPRLIVPETGSYLPGESIDPTVFVYDSEGRKVRILELFGTDNRVVVLILLGGTSDASSDSSRRGNLWCEDSFDDLAVQRALAACFKGQPVRFVAVAIPDVLSPRTGGLDNLFIAGSQADVAFVEKFSRFIEDTEKERLSTVLPFESIFYDPRGRLILGGRALGKIPPEYGEVYDWQGKFKWHLDPRTYGLPAIWVLTGEGIVACEPFWGNDYDSSPPQINYGFEELRDAVERLLE